MKRYFVEYDSDNINHSSSREDFRNSHTYGYASTVKTAKSYIRECRKRYSNQNPRNFRIYDSYADVDPETKFVPCVYHED